MDFKVGDKVRIVKCVVYSCPITLLGKIDTVLEIVDQIILEKYKSVPWVCLEKVEQDAVDIDMVYNENCVYKSEYISIKNVSPFKNMIE